MRYVCKKILNQFIVIRKINYSAKLNATKSKKNSIQKIEITLHRLRGISMHENKFGRLKQFS